MAKDKQPHTRTMSPCRLLAGASVQRVSTIVLDIEFVYACSALTIQFKTVLLVGFTDNKAWKVLFCIDLFAA